MVGLDPAIQLVREARRNKLIALRRWMASPRCRSRLSAAMTK